MENLSLPKDCSEELAGIVGLMSAEDRVAYVLGVYADLVTNEVYW
jgi:hypothetical protein